MKHSNASAFPVEPQYFMDHLIRLGQPGLTKREYAAIQIMAGFVSDTTLGINKEMAAHLAVSWTDALFKALEEKKGGDAQ